ncbi:MAG: choice-of-anchor E domain-containing protein [Planctomycetota bacterium]
MRLNYILLILGATLVPAACQAAQISFSQELTETDASLLEDQPGGFVLSYELIFGVQLPRFDPSLGTLTGVEVSVQSVSNTGVAVSIANQGSTTASGLISGGSSNGFTFPGLGGGGGGGGGGPFSLSAGESLSADFPVPLLDGPLGMPTDLSPYIGGGTFVGLVESRDSTTYLVETGSVNDLTVDLTPTELSATAIFTVAYTFDPVPEPTGGLLLGTGGDAESKPCPSRNDPISTRRAS